MHGPVTDKELKAVVSALHYVEQIGDPDLRDKVVRTLVRAWRESPYDRLEDAPNSVSRWGWNVTFVQHVNSTARAALSLAHQFKEEYDAKIDFDILLAAALLHDVDKLLIYERIGDTVEESALGKRLPHGVYGAHLALQEGMPIEVAHIIATHSPNSSACPKSVEGAIIQYADMADLDAYMISHGLPRRARPIMLPPDSH